MSVDTPVRHEDLFPTDEEYLALLDRRTRRGRLVRLGLLSLMILAVLALASLLFTIVDDSFGLVAVVNQEEPEAVVGRLGFDPNTTSLDELPKGSLVTALQGAINNNVGRRLEREQRKIQQVFTMRSLCRPGAAVPYTAVLIIFQRLIGLHAQEFFACSAASVSILTD